MTMSSERRSQPRLAIRTPAKIISGSGEIPCYTRNLSKDGFFLECTGGASCGSQIEVLLLMPGELGGGEEVWVHCHAQVKRVEDSQDCKRFGIAAAILKTETFEGISF